MTTIELKIDPRYYGKLKGPQGKVYYFLLLIFF